MRVGTSPGRLVWALAALAVVAGGCGVADRRAQADTAPLQVVTTTAIIADLARNVTGDRAEVVSLVPPQADPHVYEPSLRDVREIVYADVAFSNYLLLEPQRLIRTLDANLPEGVPNVSLAESAVKYAARIIPLVENVNLDTVWLGIAVRGDGSQHGATRSSEVSLTATGADGPGQLTAYLTETFGQPRVYIDSAAGFDPTDPFGDRPMRLPIDAHTHMSWTFEEAGVYRLDLAAQLLVDPDSPPVDLGGGTLTFAVGVDPHSVPGMDGAHVLGEGHADVAVDLDTRSFVLIADDHTPAAQLDVDTARDGDHGGPDHDHDHDHGHGDTGVEAHRDRQQVLDPARTVIEVPNTALAPIPASPDFRFLGRPAEPIYQLPQAVLGRHVHGEIDPHLWQDVGNAVAYVRIIRDTLVQADPGGAATYHRNADAYIDELYALDDEVRSTIAEIPPSRRHLITTHDAFGYLAAAYDLRIAGFVTPNPATEPSLLERRRLSETIRNLEVPAVFLEPGLAQRASVLREVADQHEVAICPIWGDAFTADVTTYVEMMRANASSLHRCLTAPDPAEVDR